MASRTAVPTSYCLTDGCHNCAEVFVREEYEEGRDYFCTIDREERPRCGSVLMNEEHYSHRDSGLPSGEVLSKAWQRWAKRHQVAAWGRCNYWTRSSKRGGT